MLAAASCAPAGQSEPEVAANPDATVEDIIAAGHVTDIAISKKQMVVAWEVEPDDDEGPHQGAWRMYDGQKGALGEGTFGTVREADAHIEVVAAPEGFLLTDYRKNGRHWVDVEGRILPMRLEPAELGTPLAGGALSRDEDADGGWQVLLPATQQRVRLTGLPSRDVQAVELTSDGTVWVLLPRTADRQFRIAYAKNGQPPWTTERIPVPRASIVSADGLSASGQRVYVVAGRARGERMTVDSIVSRKAGETQWKRIAATGIPDNLTGSVRIEALRKGRLLAVADGEGVWVQNENKRGFAEMKPPRGQRKAATLTAMSEGRWLWSSAPDLRSSLYFSDSYGENWRRFDP